MPRLMVNRISNETFFKNDGFLVTIAQPFLCK